MPENHLRTVLEGVGAHQPDGGGDHALAAVGGVAGERDLLDAVALGAQRDETGEGAVVIDRPGGAPPRGELLVAALEERPGVLLGVVRRHRRPADRLRVPGLLDHLGDVVGGDRAEGDRPVGEGRRNGGRGGRRDRRHTGHPTNRPPSRQATSGVVVSRGPSRGRSR